LSHDGKQVGRSAGWSRRLTGVVFVSACLASLGPWSSPALALSAGILFGLAGLAVFPAQSRRLSRLLIQACVVLLGFRMDLASLWASARDGFWLALATIGGAMALGLILGRLLRTDGQVATLVSSGTAICGGSAIAAVGSAIGASAPAMAVATGCVFILNAAGLYLFPLLGHALELSPRDFGVWAGVAIHDVSSVVGAASGYGGGDPAALDTANVVKLTRVVWILPLTVVAAWACRGGRAGAAPRGAVPWFIGLFLLASAVRTLVPAAEDWAESMRLVATTGFKGALFLIGSALTLETLRRVGWRALALSASLWVILASGTLAAVKMGWT
jgi:uncharacterized integral membrane protein (TIGR00698 family)